MNNAVKLAAYVVLAIAALGFGLGFYSEFKKNTAAAEAAISDTNEMASIAAPESTNQPPTNAVAETNVIASATNEVVSTNAAAQNTNAIAATTNEVAAVTNAPTQVEQSHEAPVVAKKISRGKMMAYLGAFLLSAILLGLLIAYDVTQYLGNRSVDLIFNDDLKGVHNAEYEECEQMYNNGKPLEAIQMMRDYLKRNPREQYVALRIAEIYENDLKNHLAAALEYEQVLEHNLPRERWGWAAIHLCNLYSKMGKNDQTVALLRRIAEEYSETAAAKKARKRLAMFEAAGDAQALGTDAIEDPNMPDVPPAPKSEIKRVEVPKKEELPSNLPPGFRPKK